MSRELTKCQTTYTVGLVQGIMQANYLDILFADVAEMTTV